MSDPTDINDFNQAIIEEFRANEGKVGGPFEDAPMVLVHTVGAKSGEPRVNPLVYRPLDEDAGGGEGGSRMAIFGSAAGADRHPAWFHNLKAHPDISIEVGAETREVRARSPKATSERASGKRRRQQRPALPSTRPRPPGRSPSSFSSLAPADPARQGMLVVQPDPTVCDSRVSISGDR